VLAEWAVVFIHRLPACACTHPESQQLPRCNGRWQLMRGMRLCAASLSCPLSPLSLLPSPSLPPSLSLARSLSQEQGCCEWSEVPESTNENNVKPCARYVLT